MAVSISSPDDGKERADQAARQRLQAAIDAGFASGVSGIEPITWLDVLRERVRRERGTADPR